MTIYAGASSQGGSNHSDEVSARIEPRVTETREAWRARMDAKRIYTPTLVSSSSGIAPPLPAAVPVAPRLTPAARPVPRPAPPRAIGPVTSPDTRLQATVITAYLAGDSVLEIAKRYHRGTKLIKGWLVEAGIELRGRQYPRPAGHSMTDPDPSPVPATALVDPPVVHPEPVSESNLAATYDCSACDFHIIDTTDDADGFNEAVDDHELAHPLNVAAWSQANPAIANGSTSLDAVALDVLTDEVGKIGFTVELADAVPPLPTDDTLAAALAAAGAGVQNFVAAMAELTEAATGVMNVRVLIANEQMTALRTDAARLLAMLGEGRPS